MQHLSLSNLSFICSTIFISLVLSIIPLPTWGYWLHPLWPEMVICFWILYLPQQFSLIVTWGVGLLLDILLAAPLGEHALSMVLLAFLVKKLYQRLRMFPVIQQGLVIAALLFVYQLLILWIHTLLGQAIADPRYWLAPLVTLIFWPILIKILHPHLKKHH